MLPARLQLALIALTLCAVAAVAGVMLASRSRDAARGARAHQRLGGREAPARASPCPTSRSQTRTASRSRAASLRGQPVVFAFVYSTCRDTCPAQVQTIRGALDDLRPRTRS